MKSIDLTVSEEWLCQQIINDAGAVIRDVTARWSRDKALKERLADLEKQTESTNTAV